MGINSVLGLVALMSSLLPAQDLSSIRDYSVIVSENFTTNSDVYGRTVVGGTLTVTNSANFATGLDGKVSASEKTVSIGGSLSNGNPIQVKAGGIEYGVSRGTRIINFSGGATATHNPTGNYTSIYGHMVNASIDLKALAANSTVTKPGAQPAPYVFQASPDANGLAVFNITAAELFGNQKVQQIDLLINGATDFIINVAGSSINFQYGNLASAFNNLSVISSIVWNFYEAETVNLGSKAFSGLILAPLADVTVNGSIRGTIVAQNLTSGSRIDTPFYDGTFATAPVPEPSTMFSLIFGLGFLVIRRKRKG